MFYSRLLLKWVTGIGIYIGDGPPPTQSGGYPRAPMAVRMTEAPAAPVEEDYEDEYWPEDDGALAGPPPEPDKRWRLEMERTEYVDLGLQAPRGTAETARGLLPLLWRFRQ